MIVNVREELPLSELEFKPALFSPEEIKAHAESVYYPGNREKRKSL